jgi:hypothetical protein
MRKRLYALSLFTLFMVSALALSCGTGSQGPGQLQTITLSPATADAGNYPGGMVPFVATGDYMHPTRKVTPQPATWGVCHQGAPTSDISVTKAGVAQCMSGASGAYTVFAYQMTNCTALLACGGGCTVVGTAQLTCP